MNVDIDGLEEVKELLEHALDERRWIGVEDALCLLKETLGYDPDEDEHDHEHDMEEE